MMDLATVLKNLQPRSQTDVLNPAALGNDNGIPDGGPLTRQQWKGMSGAPVSEPAPTPQVNLTADRTFHSPNQPYAGITAPQPTFGGVTPVDTPAGPLAQQPAAPLKPANVRPAFQDTGDPVGDAERLQHQAEAYKPENHNSWVKGALLGLVRGIAQGAQESGNNLLGELGGGIAGLGVGAVDKSADERYANENYTKPQAYAGLQRALGTEKEKAGIAHTQAETEDIPLKRDETTRKNNLTVAQRQYALLVRGGKGVDSVHNPQHKALVDKITSLGGDAPDVPVDIKNARLTHDALTGEDKWEFLNKDGTWQTSESVGTHTSEQGANRAFQEHQNALNRQQRADLQKEREDVQKGIAADRNAITQAKNVTEQANAEKKFKAQYPYDSNNVKTSNIQKMAERNVGDFTDPDKRAAAVDAEFRRLHTLYAKGGATVIEDRDGGGTMVAGSQ